MASQTNQSRPKVSNKSKQVNRQQSKRNLNPAPSRRKSKTGQYNDNSYADSRNGKGTQDRLLPALTTYKFYRNQEPVATKALNVLIRPKGYAHHEGDTSSGTSKTSMVYRLKIDLLKLCLLDGENPTPLYHLDRRIKIYNGEDVEAQILQIGSTCVEERDDGDFIFLKRSNVNHHVKEMHKHHTDDSKEGFPVDRTTLPTYEMQADQPFSVHIKLLLMYPIEEVSQGFNNQGLNQHQRQSSVLKTRKAGEKPPVPPPPTV